MIQYGSKQYEDTGGVYGLPWDREDGGLREEPRLPAPSAPLAVPKDNVKHINKTNRRPPIGKSVYKNRKLKSNCSYS